MQRRRLLVLMKADEMGFTERRCAGGFNNELVVAREGTVLTREIICAKVLEY